MAIGTTFCGNDGCTLRFNDAFGGTKGHCCSTCRLFLIGVCRKPGLLDFDKTLRLNVAVRGIIIVCAGLFALWRERQQA